MSRRNAFAYVFADSAPFRYASNPRALPAEQDASPGAPFVYDAVKHSLALFDRGDELTVQAGRNTEEKLTLALRRNCLILLGKLPLRQIVIKLL